jgi:acetate CoA/acetoacetate CoA-transferase alpha subunit
MNLPDKSTDIDAAIAEIPDGASIMLGGFGVPGTPFCLIDALVRHGAKGLTVIKNDANETGMGIDHLIQNGQVARLIASHIGLNPAAVDMMNTGQIEVELCPQGILAERIRAGAAGLQGILTDIALGTELALGKQQVEFNGKISIIEPALRADFAMLHADTADHFGNLTYVATARNFNPLMAMAAETVIVETEHLLPVGGLDPNHIHTPGPFVDQIVLLEKLTGEYAVVRR